MDGLFSSNHVADCLAPVFQIVSIGPPLASLSRGAYRLGRRAGQPWDVGGVKHLAVVSSNSEVRWGRAKLSLSSEITGQWLCLMFGVMGLHGLVKTAQQTAGISRCVGKSGVWLGSFFTLSPCSDHMC